MVQIDPRRKREKMVQRLQSKGITDPLVLEAMLKVPRHLFVQDALAAKAYDEDALPIGYGQTISQPHSVALMTQLLAVKRGTRVLEIGTGSGYQAAVLAQIGCWVYTVERIKELYQATGLLFSRLGITSVFPKLDDGTLGWPEVGPFDRIIVTAGGPQIPQPLVNQLVDGGILVVPVGESKRKQELAVVKKTGDTTQVEYAANVAFVDLVGSHGW